MADVTLTVNPQKVTFLSNTDLSFNFDGLLDPDDYMGTILIDNITASVRFNSANSAVNTSLSAAYTTTDKCVFDARRGKDFYHRGNGASGFFNVYISNL